jgi:cobalt-zinc-cadmium efflux system membrane fusion protein
MKRLILLTLLVMLCGLEVFLFSGCGRKENGAAGAPPPAKVEREQDSEGFTVDHPEQYPLVQAGVHKAAPELTVTGAVSPDVARTVPAVSLASGRAVEIKARLGDTVHKGQLLMKVRSNDVSSAYSEYRQAVASETLARTQFERAKVLLEKGAVAQKDLEVAADVETKARVIRESAAEKLKILGVTNLDQPPTGIIDIYAPISGVIIEQNVTAGAGVKSLDNSPNLFTVANLDHVWIMCDVYENNFPFVRLGEYADVRLNAYPGKSYKGRISNIGPILDPTIRTAKVRLEMANPGLMRIGMFVTATFYGHEEETYATVPATAILHLQDRDWVYLPAAGGKFRRAEVKSGKMIAGNLQQVTGIKPGEQVVANALALQATAQQ